MQRKPVVICYSRLRQGGICFINHERTGMLRVFITSPLEPEHVERMRQIDPENVVITYEPDLLPPTRYVADHGGVPGFKLDAGQKSRWDANLFQADALWDFPSVALDGPGVLDMAPNLRWVQTTSAGVGPLVKRLGIDSSDVIVTTASGVHAEPLAEFAFMAMLTHVKELARIQRDQQNRHWERFCSDELSGKTMAIVGPGRIGRQVAKIGKAFGMQVLAMGSRGGVERLAELGVDALYTRERLHEMLGLADVVVLSCPHTPETENMIDAAAFAAMKPGVIFINIARGKVVVEPELVNALISGRIAFAALDVFAIEPLPVDSPLWSMQNVLVSPHSGSTAFSENRKITDIFCHNLRCLLDDRQEDMRNVLDKSRLY
jgi:phosphoglycerate dehydrogenase-like enzyme